jgi:hypothetical protein
MWVSVEVVQQSVSVTVMGEWIQFPWLGEQLTAAPG